MGSVANRSQRQGRFIMPAEHLPHSHTLMAFPSIASADTEEDLAALQTEIARIANKISKFEPVHLYTRQAQAAKAKAMISGNVQVKIAEAVDQLWIRDSGPVYVHDSSGRRTAMNFNFNYWGNKLPPTGDEKLSVCIPEVAQEQSATSSLVVEGGAIEHDGEGTFLATESCIINDNRNPGQNKAEIEDEIRRTLGVEHFIWLPGIRDWDITDFHIDAFARFVEPGVVVISKPSRSAPDVVHKAYKEAVEILQTAKDAKGRSLTIHDCQEPDMTNLGAATDKHNEVVASYANYLLVNDGLILPKFGDDETDAQAFKLFKELFPTREVVQVEINMLPRTGGGIHCATQQVPI